MRMGSRNWCPCSIRSTVRCRTRRRRSRTQSSAASPSIIARRTSRRRSPRLPQRQRHLRRNSKERRMKNSIGPLGRAVLAAAVAIMIGGTATAFAQDYHEHGPDHYGYGDDHDWHDEHRPPPAYYYRGYVYRAPPPVVYAAPPPQYAPPIDLFFSIGIH